MSLRAPSIAAVIALLIGTAWLLVRERSDHRLAILEPPEFSPESLDLTPPLPGSANDATPAIARIPTDEDKSSDLHPPTLALGTGPLAWEQQIAQTAAQQSPPSPRAAALLALLPSLPAEAQAAATEQAVDGLPDRDYAAVALPALTNPETAEQAMSVLFADLMERPDAIALPTLLTIARNPRHPFAEPALDNLKLLLRADFGRDWTKWAAAVEHQTKK